MSGSTWEFQLSQGMRLVWKTNIWFVERLEVDGRMTLNLVFERYNRNKELSGRVLRARKGTEMKANGEMERVAKNAKTDLENRILESAARVLSFVDPKFFPDTPLVAPQMT